MCAESGGWKRQLAFYTHHSRTHDIWEADSKRSNDYQFYLLEAPNCIFMQRLLCRKSRGRLSLWALHMFILICMLKLLHASRSLSIRLSILDILILLGIFYSFPSFCNIQCQQGKNSLNYWYSAALSKRRCAVRCSVKLFFQDTVFFNHPQQRELL